MRLAVIISVALSSACAAEPEVPASVTGLITEIERDGSITAFTVEDDGQPYDIRIDPDRDYGFDLEHLEEHRVQELPVRVMLEERGDDVFAVEILDA